MVLAEVRGGSPAVVAHREGGARTRASEVQLAVVRSSARGRLLVRSKNLAFALF